MSKQTNKAGDSPEISAHSAASDRPNSPATKTGSKEKVSKDAPRHSLFSRILAVGGIVIILALYLATFFFAIFDRSETMSMFLASVVCTIVVPVLLYVYNWIYRLLKQDREDKAKKAAEKKKVESENKADS